MTTDLFRLYWLPARMYYSACEAAWEAGCEAALFVWMETMSRFSDKVVTWENRA